MTTQLATHPLDPDQLSLLDAIADSETPIGQLHASDFREACEAVAHDGWVNPNLVSAWLHAKWGEVNPRWYSAQWAPACHPEKGFMVTHHDVQVPIDGSHSKGNQNKSLPMRRLRNH